MKKLTKYIAAVSAAALIFSGSTAVYAADPEPTSREQYLEEQLKNLQNSYNNLMNQIGTTTQPTEKPVSQPKVKLMNPSTVTVRSGRTEEFQITVKNIGSSYANNVLTQAVPSADAPFTIQFINNSNSSSYIYEGSSKAMTLKISADKNAKAGTYAITLNHSYKNTYNENFNETDTLLVRIENASSAPNVTLHDFKNSMNSISAGDTFTVTAVMENTSTMDASEVQVLIEGLESEKIYRAGESSNTYFKTYTAYYQSYVSFELAASEKIKKGTYPIVFKVSYKDSENKVLENSYTYYVNIGSEVTASEDRARLSISRLQSPEGIYDVGEEFSVSMSIENTGVVSAKNVKITASTGTDGAVVPKSSSVQLIGSVEAGGVQELKFTFAPTSKSVTQNYVVSFTVEYETGLLDENDKPVTDSFEQFAGVNVKNSKADEEEPDKTTKTSKPKVIIESYECDPIIVAAGAQFDLKLTLQNSHSTKKVSNIKVTLTPVETSETKGSVFTPVNGSNTFFVDGIESKGTAEKTIRMFTVPDANPRNYSIMVNFKYEDEEYIEYEESELIGINVKQVTKLETSDFEVQSQSFVGTPVYLWFNIINSGKVTLSNLKVEVQGEFDSTNANMYIGSLNKTTSAYYDGSFTTNTPGTQKGRIVITCEDETGEKLELVAKEFTIEVAEMNMGGMGGMGMMDMEKMGPAQPQEQSLKDKALALVKNPYVWGGAAAALIVIVLLARKFIAKKKNMDFSD